MNTEIQNSTKIKPYEERVEKKFSTYMWMMAFAMVSIGVIFLSLTVTYLFSKNWNKESIPLTIPVIFYIDTLILVIGSFALHFASKAFKDDEIDRYKLYLYLAMLSGISFLFGQIGGWVILADSGFGLTEHKSSAFLYVISGIHALHIIGGLVFLSYIFYQASKKLQEPALAIIYFTDPIPRQHLRLIKFYWHFLGCIWLYLLVFFMIIR